VALPVPGEHNARNAAAALEACVAAGADAAAAAAALASYPGARRRLEPLGPTPAGALVYDDYAHNANEIRASLAALRTLGPQRVVAVFEPLLYSRTVQMARDWAAALARADVVLVLDVFPGSEAGDPPVSGRLLVEALAGIADGPEVSWSPTGEEAAAYLAAELREGDACIVMGSGPAPQRLARSLARSR
jgi:UDP-N-acetylmuramate--alanine ligase